MKQTLESENVDMANEIKQLTASKQESERKRKQLETAVQEANIKYVEVERNRSDLIEKVQKLQVSTGHAVYHVFHETCHSVKKDSKRCCDITTPESIHTKDESKRGAAFAFIFGVN